LAAKTAKNVPNAGDKKVKEKEKKEVEAPFVNKTPMGEKKGEIGRDRSASKYPNRCLCRSYRTHGRWI
jgi:hypothetical protein